MSDLIEPPDPDIDTLSRADLREWAHMPELAATADVLDDWLLRAHGVTSSGHNVGLFLDLLAAEGYRVEPIQVPPFDARDRIERVLRDYDGCVVPEVAHRIMLALTDRPVVSPGEQP